MTLHAAIEKLLQQKGLPMTTHEIADELNKSNWYQKKDKSNITDYQIHGRTKNYQQIFSRNGSTVSLVKHHLIKQPPVQIEKDILNTNLSNNVSRHNKDECYVLDLCDSVLELTCLRQHKFDFLLGDTNSKGVARKLPVDGYYKELNIAIEYHESQHNETVIFFDKPNQTTISGVNRGVQRKIYDIRRREVLPAKGINLIEISYTDFNYNGQKRITRNLKQDKEVIKKFLAGYIKKV